MQRLKLCNKGAQANRLASNVLKILFCNGFIQHQAVRLQSVCKCVGAVWVGVRVCAVVRFCAASNCITALKAATSKKTQADPATFSGFSCAVSVRCALVCFAFWCHRWRGTAFFDATHKHMQHSEKEIEREGAGEIRHPIGNAARWLSLPWKLSARKHCRVELCPAPALRLRAACSSLQQASSKLRVWHMHPACCMLPL